MADEKPQAASAKTRTRSPGYPSLGLEEAIRRVGVLYDKAHGHKVGMESAASEWKSNTKSSSFLQAVSALKQFGLIDDEGKGDERQIGVSALAKSIVIDDADSPDRLKAIKTAALNPPMHREIWEKYGGKLPPSDSPIRVYLLRERQNTTFHPDHVDGFISQFRSTIGFAGLTEGDIITGEGATGVQHDAGPSWESSPVVPNKKTEVAPTVGESNKAKPSTPIAMRELPVTLPSSLSVAVFKVPVPMTEADFDTLLSSLNAMKAGLIQK